MTETIADPPQATPASPPAAIQGDVLNEIKRVLAECLAGEEGLFRSLCRLAKDWNVKAERFRILLKEVGMRAPRASEIKLVLLYTDLRDKFLRGRPWKQTLQDARKRSPGALERAGEQLWYLARKAGASVAGGNAAPGLATLLL